MSGVSERRTSLHPFNGFTVLELLLVIAVIALSAGLFIVNTENTIRTIGKESATDILFNAVRQARLTAVTGKTPVTMSYNAETGDFLLRDHTREIIYRFPFGEDNLKSVETVRFWPIAPMPIQNSTRSYQEFSVVDRPTDAMRFVSTGVSSFVAVEIIYDPQIADPDWILLDPFSNGELEGELR